MQWLVFGVALILYVVFDSVDVHIADGVDVIATGPEVPTPEKDFHVGVSLKELTRHVAL